MNKKHIGIGAIELGPTSSLVGFSMFEDPNKFVFKQWTDESPLTEDVPTSILICPDKTTVHSFGTVAEKEYEILREKGKHKDYYFFSGLKTICDIEEVPRDVTVMTDETGKKLEAASVLGLMLKCLAEDGMICTSTVSQKISDFDWVVVLPASSTPSFVSLMKDAGLKVGFDENSMTIIKSTYAATLLLNNLQESAYEAKEELKLRPGLTFLTVIAGDESVDSIVNEVESDGNIRDVGTLKSCHWGIEMIVKEFEKLLVDIVGENTIDTLKKKHKNDWMNMVKNCKTKIVRETLLKSSVTFPFPASLSETTLKLTGKSLHDLVQQSKFNGTILVSADKLRISSDLFASLFDRTMQNVVFHIKKVIEYLEIKVSAMLMVGGFSEAPVFLEKIKLSFPNVAIVLFPDASKAVVRGAVAAAYSKGDAKLFRESRAPLVVAAIDFGTTYSGWAGSNQNDFRNDRAKAFVRQWNSGSALTEKTPTCVLIRSDGKTVETFGYEAISRYEELVQNEEGNAYFFFQHFKMSLHESLGEKLDRKRTIVDIAGRPLPALDVFAASIRFLKDDFLENRKNAILGSLSDDAVQWVLTVPAIWSDGAKQFMREAAIKIIRSEHGLLAFCTDKYDKAVPTDPLTR